MQARINTRVNATLTAQIGESEEELLIKTVNLFSNSECFDHECLTLKYWKKNADIDTTGLKKVLELLAGDNWYYHNETPTYKRLSNSTLWERIPDTLATQINNIYYTRFTVIKIRFEKTREYAASCKLDYLRPSGLINLEQTSTDLKKKVLVEPEKFISYLELLLVNIQRLNTVFQQSEESIEEVVKKLYTYKNNL